jgi:hypothetical protein
MGEPKVVLRELTAKEKIARGVMTEWGTNPRAVTDAIEEMIDEKLAPLSALLGSTMTAVAQQINGKIDQLCHQKIEPLEVRVAKLERDAAMRSHMASIAPKPYVPGVISEGDGWPDHLPMVDDPEPVTTDEIWALIRAGSGFDYDRAFSVARNLHARGYKIVKDEPINNDKLAEEVMQVADRIAANGGPIFKHCDCHKAYPGKSVWQPFDTAPKNGKYILARNTRSPAQAPSVIYWTKWDHSWHNVWDEKLDVEATEWAPCPGEE